MMEETTDSINNVTIILFSNLVSSLIISKEVIRNSLNVQWLL
jgi:hypothetical protein